MGTMTSRSLEILEGTILQWQKMPLGRCTVPSWCLGWPSGKGREGYDKVVTDSKGLYVLLPSGDLVLCLRSSWMVIQLSKIFLLLFFISFLWLSSTILKFLLCSVLALSSLSCSLWLCTAFLCFYSLARSMCCFLWALFQYYPVFILLRVSSSVVSPLCSSAILEALAFSSQFLCCFFKDRLLLSHASLHLFLLSPALPSGLSLHRLGFADILAGSLRHSAAAFSCSKFV